MFDLHAALLGTARVRTERGTSVRVVAYVPEANNQKLVVVHDDGEICHHWDDGKFMFCRDDSSLDLVTVQNRRNGP